MITRQGAENEFEVIWPEKISFEIGETESFIFRKDDELVFSKWVEDPDYQEEIVLRNFSGEIIKTIQGGLCRARHKLPYDELDIMPRYRRFFLCL